MSLSQLRGPHTFSLPAQFITCDVMSERLTDETVQFSQGFTPAVDLCRSLYFSPSSIPYRNEEKKRAFSLSLRDKWSSIHFFKKLLNACSKHTEYCCFSFSVHRCPTITFCYKKSERTEKKSRGETVKRPTPSVQITVQIFTQF